MIEIERKDDSWQKPAGRQPAGCSFAQDQAANWALAKAFARGPLYETVNERGELDWKVGA
jgi:hypothetical protein